MRLGGGIEHPYSNPDEWLQLVRDLNYSTVLVPVDAETSREEKRAYLDCMKKNNLVLGEVGAWRNPISTDETDRRSSLTYCKERLDLAEEMGANCCVNIAGARGEKWDGIYADNYTDEVYDLIVDSIREIIDAVNPKRTFYTVEPMPWMTPDSPEKYLKLIRDVDRAAFGVHMDYTNMINTPWKYIDSKVFIQVAFRLLGPYIKSVHIKDIRMNDKLPCSIEEVFYGTGNIDFGNVLHQCEALGPQTSVFVEHLSTYEEYKDAVRFIRQVGKLEDIRIF